MARPDLLALSVDDLVALSNAGLVKRAQKELASGELAYQIEETAEGNVKVEWSDGVECQLPANTVLSKSLCSCPATTLCRHLLRSVLAYQQNSVIAAPVGSPTEEEATPETPAVKFWNPGLIGDEVLAKHYSSTGLTRARHLFDQGQLIEVITGAKPSAHIHTLACTVRFLVEGDIRYTHCDCTEEAPCSQVLLAVWAFRFLADGQEAGLFETNATRWPVPAALLTEIEQRLKELAGLGLSNAPQALIEHFRRLENRAQAEGLAWPATILAELIQQIERYAARDARFEPNRVAELIAELLVRNSAINSNTGEVPQLFVRGMKSDKLTEVGHTRLVGLGCGGKLNRKSVELASYMQNPDSGLVLAIRHEFSDDPINPTPFSQLAQTTITKGLNLAALGSGQLVIKNGKRTAGHQLILGRSPLSPGPQTYQWESLRAPLLAESFDQLQAHLQLLPPAYLRPRHLTGDFFVCAVAGVQSAVFSPIHQAVVATVQDHEGHFGRLYHPYTSRGQAGCEALLDMLNRPDAKLCFVSGTVRMAPDGPVISLVGLVFEQEGRRIMLQPWVASSNSLKQYDRPLSPNSATASTSIATPVDPLAGYLGQVMAALADLYLTGLERLDNRAAQLWQHLLDEGTVLGFVQLLQPMTRLVNTLKEKDERLVWDWQNTAEALLDLTLLTGLALEELAHSLGASSNLQ